jgi:hypothetical protein
MKDGRAATLKQKEKEIMKTKLTLTIATALLALSVLVTLGFFRGPWRAQAQSETPAADASAEGRGEFLAFGVLGITPGQTARLHAVALGVPETQEVELLIYDSRGHVLARSPERLHPGRPATLALPFIERDGNRLELYAVIRLVNGAPRRGYVISTLEVVDDATGKTMFASVNPEG